MRWVRLSITSLIVLMVVVPFCNYFESESEASGAIPLTYRSELLLSNPAPIPSLSRNIQLDKLVIARYVLKPAEDIYSICQRFNIKQYVTTIRSSNGLDESPAPGTELLIPNRTGTLFQVQKPQTLREITSGFEIGRKGGLDYDRQVMALNQYPAMEYQGTSSLLRKGSQIFLPNAYIPVGLPIPFHDMHFRVTSVFTSHRRHPVLGITRAHKGMDLARPYGDPVYAPRAGVITQAGWMGGYGNMIEIRHVMRNGHIRYTRYGHLSAILVHEGQRVSVGKLIGKVGSTGISTGPHLHFEVRDENGEARNPGKSF